LVISKNTETLIEKTMANKKNRKKILSYTVIYQAVPEGGYIAFVPSFC